MIEYIVEPNEGRESCRNNARNYILVGVADVERVSETAELGEDAASEPVMVLDEATLTADEDIPAPKNFQSPEVKAGVAEVPNHATQVVVGDDY